MSMVEKLHLLRVDHHFLYLPPHSEWISPKLNPHTFLVCL